MSQPTWKDAPEIPLGILQRLAASEPLPAPIGQPEWECVRDEVLAQSILGWGPVRRIFLRLLERARRFAQLREDTHFYLTLPMPVERRCVLELGRRLADAGILDRTEDVFFLTLEELQAVGPSWPPSPSLVHQLSTSAAARKTRWEALASQPFVDPSVVATSRPVNDWILSGIPGSAGVAEGRCGSCAVPLSSASCNLAMSSWRRSQTQPGRLSFLDSRPWWLIPVHPCLTRPSSPVNTASQRSWVLAKRPRSSWTASGSGWTARGGSSLESPKLIQGQEIND